MLSTFRAALGARLLLHVKWNGGNPASLSAGWRRGEEGGGGGGRPMEGSKQDRHLVEISLKF